VNGSLDQALAAAVRAELRRAIAEELVPAIREVLNDTQPIAVIDGNWVGAQQEGETL